MTATDTMTATDLAQNPLMQREGLPVFDAISPEHVLPGVEASLAEVGEAFDALEAGAEPTWDGLLLPMEAIGRVFEYCWGPVGHLMAVKNSDELRNAYMAAQPMVVQLGLRMSQSRPVYDALVALRDGDEWAKLDLAQQRIVESKVRDMKLSGVALEGEEKKRYLEIAERLSALSTEFSNHVLDATKAFELIITDPADTEGWTTTLRAMASASYNEAKEPEAASTPESGPWRITLAGPSFVAFMQHSRNREQREQVYRAFISRATGGDLDNGPLIVETLKLRKEKAALLGYDTHAEISLATKMAGTVDRVQQMFDELTAASKPGMDKDLQELRSFAKEQGEDSELMHWDLSFWAERMREQKFDYTDEEIRPYFPLPRVMDGLFGICKKLFGVTFERDDDAAPRWHADVSFYNVINGQGSAIASFYFDPYSRPADKRGGAWVNGCLSRRVVEGEVINPVYHVICNGTNPTADKPSLMSFDEVITLFHEFGHALQGMLTEIDYADAAGLSGIEWDAVEICSQFMENWCYDKPTLTGMTEHVETGEALPGELFDKLVKARTYRAGSNLMRQLCLGVTDMTLHTTFDPEGDQSYIDAYRGVAKDYTPLPPLDEDNFLCAFSHIFAGGYSAGYYSYKWSEVLSADCFGAFEEAALDDAGKVVELGQRFRDTFLKRGGGEHPMDVFKAFRGREPSTEALLRHNGLAP
ncbi:MAG: M3 family metallopeptidase [Phycisphaeraceae bacterium]|nr:M3 family metallopeptidase [Phycisphaeraceae bacterium]